MSKVQMHAPPVDPAIVSARELTQMAAEGSRLRAVVEDPNTPWVESTRAKARLGELTRLIEADAKARERAKVDADNRKPAAKPKKATNAGCGQRYAETVLARDSQGRASHVARTPIGPKPQHVRNLEPSGPKFAEPTPYYERPAPARQQAAPKFADPVAYWK